MCIFIYLLSASDLILAIRKIARIKDNIADYLGIKNLRGILKNIASIFIYIYINTNYPRLKYIVITQTLIMKEEKKQFQETERNPKLFF